MLTRLHIKNYALISDADIRFGGGLNILTGETGAGKSILMAALGTILGDRVDTTALRAGASKAVIEGSFDIDANSRLSGRLRELALDDGSPGLILRREILDSGRTRAFVNDTPVQLSLLQEIGNYLVDLHGQHDHQSLLRESQHIEFLDEYGALAAELAAVQETHRRFRELAEQLQAVQKRKADMQARRDFLQFQADEIDKLMLTPDEEEDLLAEEKRVRHAERLFELTSEITRLLYEDDDSIFDKLNIVLGKVDELQGIDSSVSRYLSDCESARVVVEEMAKSLQSYNSGITFEPDRLETIQSRLAELAGARKKYQKSIAELVAYRSDIANELSGLDTLSEDIDSLQKEVAEARARFSDACLTLSSKRHETAVRLESSIPGILGELGMPGAQFVVGLTLRPDPAGDADIDGQSYVADSRGMDFANFQISANTGEPLKPLSRVASGGEVSRIMLALKSLLARKGQIPVLVFDEIDSGVSGRVARAVGMKLRALSEHHQVICITHLAQIASLGMHHYLVEKSERGGRTHTGIREIVEEEREEAIARLLAGKDISEAHLSSARELLMDPEVG